MEQEFRPNKRGGGVSLYLHNSLQYKLRDDLKVGDSPGTVNSIFVEICKNSIGSKCDLIVGCVYRPPWVRLSTFNDYLEKSLASCTKKQKHILINIYVS